MELFDSFRIPVGTVELVGADVISDGDSFAVLDSVGLTVSPSEDCLGASACLTGRGGKFTSSIAPVGHSATHFRQSLHFSGSM